MKRLTDEQIRLSCLGEGVYWAGELSLTAADPPEGMIPQFRRVAVTQLAQDQQHERELVTEIIGLAEEIAAKCLSMTREEMLKEIAIPKKWQALKAEYLNGFVKRKVGE